ncbi:MAG: ABC transporter permease, partial [Acidobacteriota bacterium]
MPDLLQAFRSLRRTPGFTVLAVLTLGLAIGVTAGLFSVIDAVLLNPLPFADSDRLITITASAPGSDMPDEFGVAAEFYVQYAEESTLLESVSTYNSFTNTLRVDDQIERIRMSAPTPTLFETLGVSPIRGRLPVAEDEGGVVVISHALWMTWFGGAEDVLGRTVYAGGEDRTIIGIMPRDFWFPVDGTLLWFPDTIRAEDIRPGRFGQPLVARVAPGTSDDALKAELTMLAQRLPDRFGIESADYLRLLEQFRPVVQPLETRLLGDVARPLWILLASMAIVLLIACANVANLFMVRAERRQAEQAIRTALGAARGRLIAAQLGEASVVAALAGAVAVALAWAGVPLLLHVAPDNVPRLGEVSIGPSTLLATF